jgi:hypothetical protein
MDAKTKRLFFLESAFLSSCVALLVACGAKDNADDGNMYGLGGKNGSSGKNGQLTAGSGASNGICADKTVATSRAAAWVLFVIDRSQTMADRFGSTTRWEAVYDTLMKPGSGIISVLQNEVSFGIMLFDGQGTCPRLETVAPALKNYNKINALYGRASPGLHTPTALALNAAYKIVEENAGKLDNAGVGRQFVVLCTDGEPNGCPSSDILGAGSAAADFDGPINEVTTAAKNGIKTYVVSVASSGPQYKDFLDRVASIGNTGSPAFSPTTKDELVKQLGGIVGNAVGCEIHLSGQVVTGKACSGTVMLNSKSLECNNPNGWKLVDETHIELLGTACQSFMNDSKAILNTTFPCDAVVVL